MKKIGGHRNSRGYSLVEIALALAVLGLLLGGSLIPFSARERDEREEETEEAIQRAINAVAAYAVRHQTAEGYSVNDGARVQELPGGRPYLPCPDTDSDGVENRIGVNPPPYVIDISPTTSGRGLADEFGDPGDGGAFCDRSWGALPWATLGLPAADLWGNPYSYRVDIAYSHGLLGFGPETRADKFHPALRLTAGGGITVPQVRQSSGSSGTNELPIVVCRNLDCDGNGEIVSGIIAESTVTITDGDVTKIYDPNDTLDGLAFVIVSHGPNGAGFGALHITSSVVEVPECSRLIDPFYHLEQLNALACVDPGSGLGPGSGSRSDNYINFVDAPRGIGSEGGGNERFYDDIVGWMSGESLIAEMGRSGVLPVDNLPQFVGP